MKIVLAALVLAFPLILGLTWSFRFSADGLVREVDLPETDPAAQFEHEQHEKHKKGGHGHGHGGGDGVDPLPIIMGVLTLAALVLLVVIKFVAPDSLGGGHGTPHGAARSAAVHDAPGEAVAAAAPAHGASASTAPSNSIAVLPFDNLSGDPAQVYFSDGMAEELRGALAGVEGLQVAARTSSNAFRGSNADVGTIAGRLGVAYVLDGSVRRDGPKVRIATQLIEAKSGFERWSQTYDREVRDVFKVQSDVARTVTDALKVKLLPGDTARLKQGNTRSATALDAYLKGPPAVRPVGRPRRTTAPRSACSTRPSPPIPAMPRPMQRGRRRCRHSAPSSRPPSRPPMTWPRRHWRPPAARSPCSPIWRSLNRRWAMYCSSRAPTWRRPAPRTSAA